MPDVDLIGFAKAVDAEFSRQERKRLAFVGKTSAGPIEVSGRSFYVWARAGTPSGPPFQVYDANRNAPRIIDAAIEIVERENAPGRFEVAGMAGTAPPAIVNAAHSTVQMSYGGANPIIVSQRQMREGVLYQTDPPSMKVRIASGWAYVDGTLIEWDTQETGTLAAPASGKGKWVAVGLNKSTGLIATTDGAEYDKTLPTSAVKPSMSASWLPIGYVLIFDITTALYNGENLKSYPPYLTWGADAFPFGNENTPMEDITLEQGKNYVWYGHIDLTNMHLDVTGTARLVIIS